MNLAEKLREIDPGEMVVQERVIKKSVCLDVFPVVAEEEVKPEPQVRHVVQFDWVLENDIGDLIALPLVGQVVGKYAEVAPVAGRAVGVAGKAVFDPAVEAPRFVLNAERFSRKLISGAGSRAASVRWITVGEASAAIETSGPPSRGACEFTGALGVASRRDGKASGRPLPESWTGRTVISPVGQGTGGGSAGGGATPLSPAFPATGVCTRYARDHQKQGQGRQKGWGQCQWQHYFPRAMDRTRRGLFTRTGPNSTRSRPAIKRPVGHARRRRKSDRSPADPPAVDGVFRPIALVLQAD